MNSKVSPETAASQQQASSEQTEPTGDAKGSAPDNGYQSTTGIPAATYYNPMPVISDDQKSCGRKCRKCLSYR